MAVIGSGISVSGEITGNQDLCIDGKVEGTINLRDNVITVNHSGEVRANITASTANISGQIVGDIIGIEQVVLTKSARVRGNIVAPRVKLEDGTKFKGSIDMDPVEERPAAGRAAQQSKADKQPSPAQARPPSGSNAADAKDASFKRAAPSSRESAPQP